MRFHILAAIIAFTSFSIAAPAENAPAENAAVASISKRTTHDGEGTVYAQEGAYGSCGQKHSDSDMIAALSNYWQLGEYKGPFCGRKVKVTNTGSNDNVGGKGNSVIVTVEDTCEACNENHIDFSIGAWDALTNKAPEGTIEIEWHFCSADGDC